MASYVTGGQLPTFRHSQATSETALFQSAVCMGGLLAAIGFTLFATTARAQGAPAPQADSGVTNPPSTTGSTNLTNQANNPVAPLPEILVQNYLMPAPQGYDGRLADEELLRLTGRSWCPGCRTSSGSASLSSQSRFFRMAGMRDWGIPRYSIWRSIK